MKRYLSIFFSLILIVCCSISTFRFNIPDNSYYVDVNSNFGELRIFVPVNYSGSIGTTDNGRALINEGTSSITCYRYLKNNTNRQYQITFYSYGTSTYGLASIREYQNNNQLTAATALGITSINDTNLHLLDDTDFTFFSNQVYVSMAVLLVLGVMLVCIMRL